jgi:hypothetical protein
MTAHPWLATTAEDNRGKHAPALTHRASADQVREAKFTTGKTNGRETKGGQRRPIPPSQQGQSRLCTSPLQGKPKGGTSPDAFPSGRVGLPAPHPRAGVWGPGPRTIPHAGRPRTGVAR